MSQLFWHKKRKAGSILDQLFKGHRTYIELTCAKLIKSPKCEVFKLVHQKLQILLDLMYHYAFKNRQKLVKIIRAKGQYDYHKNTLVFIQQSHLLFISFIAGQIFGQLLINLIYIVMNRLQHLSSAFVKEDIKAGQSIRNKQQWFKNNGWGFKDTEFLLADDGTVQITGSRYQFSGQKMPKFKEWVQAVIGIDTSNSVEAQREIPIDPVVQNLFFIEQIKGKVDEINTNKMTRIFHSHGHSLKELYMLRFGKLPRTVDYVVYITSHEQAEHLIEAAKKHNVVLIPFGGGTNVTESLMCQEEEKRTIVSVDVTRMNKVKWVDKSNMIACIEAGIIGKDMEKELSKFGVMCGHEPDSVEFSSLGGWVSTRASGMKKNRYGNIDDIIIGVKIATPIGTFQKVQNSPRVSSGPDIHEFILGHEGNFGIITECTVKVRPMPEKKVYESFLFHDFDIGVKFMYDVSQSKVWPASLRLMDNKQFQFGMSLKTEQKSKLHEAVNAAKKYFITEIMGFDPNKMTLCTILFEGSALEVKNQMDVIYQLAKKYKGFRAGAQNGERGYFLTFMIGYLRDFGFRYNFIAESFQTSLPWKDVTKMCSAVSKRIASECKKHGIKKQPFLSSRVTQVYDTGACVYIYFGFIYQGLADPVAVYSQIQDAARDEIMKYGGCISHHHGVGKLRKKFMPRSIGNTGIDILKGLKKTIDPENVFATGNLI